MPPTYIDNAKERSIPLSPSHEPRKKRYLLSPIPNACFLITIEIKNVIISSNKNPINPDIKLYDMVKIKFPELRKIPTNPKYKQPIITPKKISLFGINKLSKSIKEIIIKKIENILVPIKLEKNELLKSKEALILNINITGTNNSTKT